MTTLLEQDFFQRYEYGDFVRFRYKNRLMEYILVLGITVQAVYWEIEIWFVFENSAEEAQIMSLVQRKLTTRTREIILNLKQERMAMGLSKHHISSVDIYKGVLEQGLVTLDEIDAWLNTHEI